MNILIENSLYLVLLISLICWLGIYVYLLYLNKKISKLDDKLKKDKE